MFRLFFSKFGVPCALVLVASLFASSLGACAASSNNSAPLTPDEKAGKALAMKRCLGCHTTDGSSSAGPTWKGLSGSTITMSDGRSIVADDQYLTRAIADPDAEGRKGYQKTMGYAVPPNTLNDEQIKQLVAYIKAAK